MRSRVPRSGGKTLPVSLDLAGYVLPTRVIPTPSPALLLATVWRGLTGMWRASPTVGRARIADYQQAMREWQRAYLGRKESE